MGIYGFTVLRIIYPALRWLGWALVLLYVAIVLTLLGIRYVVFPKIEHYTPYIEAELSALFDASVELGDVRADFHRLNPRIEIKRFSLHDVRGVPVLTVPQFTAVLSWRSLLSWSPQFVSVHAGGADLTVRRDSGGQLWLMGRSLERSDAADNEPVSDVSTNVGDRTVRWLAAQPQIRLYDATLRWVDESRNGQELVLQDVNLKVRNRGNQHQFSLTAHPANGVGGSFDMRGNFQRSSDMQRPMALESGEGQLYVHIEDMRPEVWRAWIDWPDFLKSDRVSIRTWFDVSQGEPVHVTTDIRVSDALWQSPAAAHVHTAQADLFATGPWERFREGRMDFSLRADHIELSLPDMYDQAIFVRQLALRGSTGRDTEPSLQLDHFSLHNPDIAINGQLKWIPASGNPVGGQVDAQAHVSRARLDAVHRYMPKSVSHDVRDWLKYGLLAGQIEDAHLVLRGDMSDFPFDEASEGQFRIFGDYRDAIIDYLPEDENSVGWPRLGALQGHIVLERTALEIFAAKGEITPIDGAVVQLSDVHASIDDLRDDPILQVNGQTQGDGAAYIAFLQGSELNGILNHAFDKTTAHGAWRLPLALTIPLSRSADTKVAGTVQIEDGHIHIDPAFPPFADVRGHIEFTEEGVSIPSMAAHFLEGKVELSGGTGPQHQGLSMAGQVKARDFRTLIDVPGMARFDGTTAYVATLSGIGPGQKGLTFRLSSELKGMALDFPPPLNKAAADAWPLVVSWSHGTMPSARELDITLNNNMRAHFSRGKTGSRTYFDSGRLGVGREAEPVSKGLNVDIEHPVFDADAWNAIVREFSSAESKQQQPVFPEMTSLRVQTTQGRLLGLPLEELTYTVKQQSETEWRADISSTQTAGTLKWIREGDVIQGPVQAVFHRLAFGDEIGDDSGASSAHLEISNLDEPQFQDDLRIPAVNLLIENLRLYGRDVGKLALVGVNEDRGDTWRLEQFALSSMSAHLEGRGVWRLRGPDRGLSLDAEVDVSDLGDYFDQIGFEDLLSAGAGTIEIDIDWHNLPWTFDVNEIDGQVSFEFTKGRLSTMNSRSARLLELISLQSVRRLATLDLNPLHLTKDGFPYDLLRGALRLEHGRIHTEDYRITGPVGTIVLDGLVHLKTGSLDLQAVVVPNIDVSGAAIAAGVAINPVVGIGAFLTQWLLKAPLAAAMTAQYKIDGDWEQPEIKAVERVKGQDDP